MSDWIGVVKDLATRRWATTGKALLLAQIPGLLKESGINLADVLSGRKLKEAIELEAAGTVRFVRDGLVWGVVPAEASVTPGQDLFSTERPEHHSNIPKFRRSVWAAFVRDIETGRKRFITAPEFNFSDVDASAMPPPNAIEVAPEYIVQSDMLTQRVSPEAVAASIERWCSATRIQFEDLLAVKSEIGRADDADRRSTGSASLARAFSSLSEEDLRRITVPMDIVVKMLRKS